MTNLSQQWWDAQGDALATEAWKRVDSLRTRTRTRNVLDLTYEAIYRGCPMAGGRVSVAAPATIDIARAKADAVWSRMSKHRPFPVISCLDAGYTERRFALRVSDVLHARLAQTSLEKDKLLRVREALIRGTAAAKVIRTNVSGKWDVTVERVPRCEILVNPREARYGCPRSMWHIKSYPLEVALAMFPGKVNRDALTAAASKATLTDEGYFAWGDEWADDSWQVVLCEGWHLPSGPEAKDGVNVICTRNRVLQKAPWSRPRFPISLLHWSPPIRGMLDGGGLIEQLMPIQAGINQSLRDAQEALYYGAQLKVFVPRQANINKEHLRARHPAVVEYDGAKPEYVAPNPVSQQLYSHMQWLLQMADDISGLSRDFQSGNSQLSPDASGRAREVMDDIQSDRFAAFELFHSLDAVDIGTLMVDEARSIAADYKASECAPWIAEHRWRKVDIDAGKYHLTMEPENFLPKSRAGRLSAIEQMGKAGLIKDTDDLIDGFTEPDLARMNRKLLGPRNAIKRVLEGLADTDVDLYELTPDGNFPLDAGIVTVNAELQDAWSQKAEPEVLDRFRAWLSLAEKKQSEAKAAALPPAPPPGMPMDPMAPPVDPGMVPPDPMAGGMPMGAPPMLQ